MAVLISYLLVLLLELNLCCYRVRRDNLHIFRLFLRWKKIEFKWFTVFLQHSGINCHTKTKGLTEV